MPIHQYLDVSTANITQEDNNLLSGDALFNDSPPFRVIEHDYGYWVNVQRETSMKATTELHLELKARGYSTPFVILYARAQRKGCYWINIDRDGEPEKGLTVFEW